MVRSTTSSFLGIALAAGCTALAARADEPLLLVDQPPVEATLIAVDSEGSIEFESTEGTRKIPVNDLVRWSTPYVNLERQELILVDGSRLVLEESWSGKSHLRVEKDTVIARTELLGSVVLPRKKLRAILLNAPADNLRHSRIIDQLLAFQGGFDQLLLRNGDVLTGTLASIDQHDSAAGLVVTFALETADKSISFAANRVAGFGSSSSEKAVTDGDLAVGLRDGCYLRVRSLVADARRLQLELASGFPLTGKDHRDMVHLQSLSPRITYLSNLEPAGYQHKPYLDIPWPYRRDRNVLGGPLAVGGRTYKKGLGIHSSSWLTFDLPRPSPAAHNANLETRYQRFAAQAAIDDLAEGRGSSVFRVLLLQDELWVPAYTSPIVRGGDPPLSVSVDLGGAEQIALEADYADHGDERDYANWLDARLE